MGVELASTAALAAVVLLGLAAGPANGELEKRAPSPEVACFHYGGGNVSFERKPRKCNFITRGCEYAICEMPTKSLKWRRWGRPTATAKGKAHVTSVGWKRVKVKLSKVRDPRCGGRVYTKATFKLLQVDSKGSIRLDQCRR